MPFAPTYPIDAYKRSITLAVDPLKVILRTPPATPNDVALTLFDPLINGNHEITGVTELFKPTWARTIRRRGGHFIGTVSLTEKDLSVNSMEEYFMTGILREIRERGGGTESWRGFLARTEFFRRGDTFVQDITTMANAMRMVYTRIGDNLLINGGGESGAWTAYNSATVTQSTDNVIEGTYSIEIVVADAVKRGAVIQAAITIAAGVEYEIVGKLFVVSGSWTCEVYRTDTGARLARYDSGGQTGDVSVLFYIPVENDYGGSVSLRLTSIEEAGAATCYADAFAFRVAPYSTETKWYSDAASISMFGRKERIMLEGDMSGDAANNGVLGQLVDTAWPNPKPPRSWQTHAIDPKAPATLNLTFVGYWAMLNWLYASIFGTYTNTETITNLLALQPAILPGVIETNAADYQLVDGDLLRIGDVFKAIVDASDASGDKWGIGVYADRKLHYEHITEDPKYYYANGQLLDLTGGPIEPWLALPGWAIYEDLPISTSLTSHQAHDPRHVFIEEVEMRADGTIGINLDESGGVD